MCMVSIKYKCPHLDAPWVRVHACWIPAQHMWRLRRRNRPSSRRTGSPVSKHKWSWKGQKFGHYPDRIWSQERLCLRGLSAIYCYAMLCYSQAVGTTCCEDRPPNVEMYSKQTDSTVTYSIVIFIWWNMAHTFRTLADRPVEWCCCADTTHGDC
jgi:hypothetical protein